MEWKRERPRSEQLIELAAWLFAVAFFVALGFAVYFVTKTP